MPKNTFQGNLKQQVVYKEEQLHTSNDDRVKKWGNWLVGVESFNEGTQCH